jgi:hypothetical protein
VADKAHDSLWAVVGFRVLPDQVQVSQEGRNIWIISTKKRFSDCSKIHWPCNPFEISWESIGFWIDREPKKDCKFPFEELRDQLDPPISLVLAELH